MIHFANPLHNTVAIAKASHCPGATAIVQLVAQGSCKETKAFADKLCTGEVEVTAIGTCLHKQGNRIFDVAEQRYVADCTTREAAEAALRLLK